MCWTVWLDTWVERLRIGTSDIRENDLARRQLARLKRSGAAATVVHAAMRCVFYLPVMKVSVGGRLVEVALGAYSALALMLRRSG